ncbi:hypothetical protein TNCV_3591631 [Trichonephila clavipes]|nr:hypothetical protein TNCV_3591631 [Trichonephila clavipes]
MEVRKKFPVVVGGAVVSFPKGRNKSCQSLRQVGLLYYNRRHHLSPSPQFKHGTGGEGNILQLTASVLSASNAHKTFRPTFENAQ